MCVSSTHAHSKEGKKQAAPLAKVATGLRICTSTYRIAGTALRPRTLGRCHGGAHRSTAQHGTAQHSTARHSTAQHSTAQHSTAQRPGPPGAQIGARPSAETGRGEQPPVPVRLRGGGGGSRVGGRGRAGGLHSGRGENTTAASSLCGLSLPPPRRRRRLRPRACAERRGGGSLRPVAVPKSPGIPCNRHPAPSDIRRSSLLPAYPPVAGYERSAVRRPALKGEGKKTPHPVRFLPSPVPVVWCGTRLATTSHDSTSPGRPPHPGFLAVRSTENARDSWKRGGHYPWARQSGLHGSAASQPSPAIAVSCRLQLTQHSQVGSSPARRRHRRTDRQRRVSARFTESDRERERERESKNLG